MKRILSLLIVLLVLSSAICASDEVLAVRFNLDRTDIVEIINVRLVMGSETLSQGTDYSIVLKSSNGQVMQTTYFDAVFTAHADEGFPFPQGQEGEEQGISVDLDEIELIVRIPYMASANSYEIRSGTTVLFQDTISLCNNNGACEVASGENYLSCPDDCPSGSSDDYCDEVFDGTCDADCTLQGRDYADTDCTCGDGTCDAREDSITCPSDCGAPSNMITNMLYTIIGIIVVVVIIIIVIIVMLVKKKKPKK